MEINPTPFPVVKSQYMKPKSTKKISDAPKINFKNGPPLLREKRVFGTARNPNVPSKSVPEKPIKGKPSSAPPRKALKPSQPTQLPPPPPITEAKNSSSEKNPAKTKKKSVCFKENNKFSGDKNIGEPQTPAKSPADLAKPRHSATPYRTAEKCSKCRFDKLETSVYWLSQIKLAESVGKHSVSSAFFRLAFDSKAEPIRNIRVELKKYIGRHEYLNEEEEWKKLFVSYGLMKEEISVKKDEEKASVDDQEDDDLVNESADEENPGVQNQQDMNKNAEDV